MSNKAAWITASKANPLEIDDAPLPKAGADEVVIKNHAAAVNPVDWKIQVELSSSNASKISSHIGRIMVR